MHGWQLLDSLDPMGGEIGTGARLAQIPHEVTALQRRTAMRVIDNGCIVSSEAKAMFAAAILALVSAVFCTTAAAARQSVVDVRNRI